MHITQYEYRGGLTKFRFANYTCCAQAKKTNKEHQEEECMNYNNKKFSPVENSENGETTAETIFEYKQNGNILTSEYSGGEIVSGHLIGLVDDKGNIEMRYHQVNIKGKLMTGICFSKPEITANGKIRLYEEWKWTSGNKSSGKSILEERKNKEERK